MQIWNSERQSRRIRDEVTLGLSDRSKVNSQKNEKCGTRWGNLFFFGEAGAQGVGQGFLGEGLGLECSASDTGFLPESLDKQEK